MGQNNKLAGIYCVCDTPFTPELKGSRLDKIKFFAYMAVIVCLFGAFSGNILVGLATSTGDTQDHSVRPAYVVFAIDASLSMNSTLEDITDTSDSSKFYTLNKSIDVIISNNSENRVGLVIWNINKSHNPRLINTGLTNDVKKLKNAVGQITSSTFPGDHSCIREGLVEAGSVLNKSFNDDPSKSIIFISDGKSISCGSEDIDRKGFCQSKDELNRNGIDVYEFSGICSNSEAIADSINIKRYLNEVIQSITPTVEFTLFDLSYSHRTRNWDLTLANIAISINQPIMGVMVGISISAPISLVAIILYRERRRIRRLMRRIGSKIHQKISNIFKKIRELLAKLFPPKSNNTTTCRGDMMIKKSVTKSVIPNVVTINGNGSASEDITIEITLPTERCNIGADVAFAIDCSASMYNSDGNKMKRRAVVESIIRKLRRESDRAALLYWKGGQLQKMQNITSGFDSVLKDIKKSLSEDSDQFDMGGTNFNELLKGALDSIYQDGNGNRPYTRSIIILSDAVPEGEDGPGGLKFDSEDIKRAIDEKEKMHGGEKVAFYSVGIKQHPLGKPILQEITKLGDDNHQGLFVPIEEIGPDAIAEKMIKISAKLIQFENLTNVKIIDILPPYLKEPHDFKKIIKPINGKLKEDVVSPLVETNPLSYTTTINWDLGPIEANGDIWKLTFKARLEFPIPTNMIGMGKEDVMSQIIYNDQRGNEHKISLDPGEIRFKPATE